MNANEWNSKYPVGTLVKYIPPGRRDGDFTSTETLGPAFDTPERSSASVRIEATDYPVNVSYLIPDEEL